MVIDLDPELVAASAALAILKDGLLGKRKIGSYLRFRDVDLVAAQSKGLSSGFSVEKDTGRPSTNLVA
jgi:hypothetical protein